MSNKVSYLGTVAGTHFWVSPLMPFIHPTTGEKADSVSTNHGVFSGGFIVSPERASDLRKEFLEKSGLEGGEEVVISKGEVPDTF